MGERVFSATLTLRQGRCSIHLVLVILQDRDLIPEQQERGRLQLALVGVLKGTLGVVKTVQEEKGGRKIGVAEYSWDRPRFVASLPRSLSRIARSHAWKVPPANLAH